MKIVVLIVLFLASGCSLISVSSQNLRCTIDSLTGECVYLFVEEMPIYCNGNRNFGADVFSSMELDSMDMKDMITKVHLQFVINKGGKLIGARIVGKDVVHPLEMQVLKAVKGLDCIWSVGKLYGKEVSVLLTYTIHIDTNG